MLFIFRQLRRLELRQRSGRYFVYAIGEVVLIVIGILIALQIQTWNENRQLREYEISILREFSAALGRDQNAIDTSFLPRLERKETTASEFLTRAAAKTDVSDEEFIRYFSRLRSDWGYRFETGPYDALKSVGFDRISNESLRRDIMKAYSFGFPGLQQFIKKENEEYDARVIPLLDDIIEPTAVFDEGEARFQPKILVDPIITHPSFVRILNYEWRKANNQRSRLDQITERVDELKAKVDAELERLTGEPVEQQSDE